MPRRMTCICGRPTRSATTIAKAAFSRPICCSTRRSQRIRASPALSPPSRTICPISPTSPIRPQDTARGYAAAVAAARRALALAPRLPAATRRWPTRYTASARSARRSARSRRASAIAPQRDRIAAGGGRRLRRGESGRARPWPMPTGWSRSTRSTACRTGGAITLYSTTASTKPASPRPSGPAKWRRH